MPDRGFRVKNVTCQEGVEEAWSLGPTNPRREIKKCTQSHNMINKQTHRRFVRPMYVRMYDRYTRPKTPSFPGSRERQTKTTKRENTDRQRDREKSWRHPPPRRCMRVFVSHPHAPPSHSATGPSTITTGTSAILASASLRCAPYSYTDFERSLLKTVRDC